MRSRSWSSEPSGRPGKASRGHILCVSDFGAAGVNRTWLWSVIDSLTILDIGYPECQTPCSKRFRKRFEKNGRARPELTQGRGNDTFDEEDRRCRGGGSGSRADLARGM